MQDSIFELLSQFSHLDLTELPSYIYEIVMDTIFDGGSNEVNMGEGSYEHAQSINQGTASNG